MNEDAWFVRRGRGWLISIRPRRWQGWLITALYAGIVLLLANVVKSAPRALLWVWPVVIAALTLVFVVTAYRLSEPEKPEGGK
ncbi:hypothetical protein P1X14_07755 [Sphingomonas sp. AOB5]|uniref:hypothetical protein n=1 Tax=Sphingomonas sp. AOB5 TaxID=3034017 RepID=UPI0023F80785|nr:hypothetical protein [Sphingomonas sp. AOB5]MDF7775137.1 hypothetical protein [Sphingomonas sp. AOB5]